MLKFYSSLCSRNILFSSSSCLVHHFDQCMSSLYNVYIHIPTINRQNIEEKAKKEFSLQDELSRRKKAYSKQDVEH